MTGVVIALLIGLAIIGLSALLSRVADHTEEPDGGVNVDFEL